MKRSGLFITMLVLASLLLAACGAQETPTSVPNTSAPLPTNTSEVGATEAATTAPTATSEANMTSTPVIPVTGGTSPSQRITSLMGTPICGMAGDQLGTVQDMVLDFDQGVVTYMIVDANGKSVAVPYAFITKPRNSGMGTGSGNGTSRTGALSTSTPSTEGAIPTATSATGSSSGTGTQSTSTPATGGAVSTATPTTGTGTGSYSSLLLLTWRIFFKSLSMLGFVLAVAASFFLILTAKADEAECIQFFGASYLEYRKSTKMFIPFLFCL